MDTRDMTAIVVGGASGLGRATARRLASGGAKVWIFDVDGVNGRAAADEIGGIFHLVDATDEHSVVRAFQAVETAGDVGRILVNCAGIAPVMQTIGSDGQPHSAELFRKVISVNLLGTAIVLATFAARLAVADTIGEERGVIINTASIAAFEGGSGQLAYSASKAGVAAMALPAARDLAKHRIRVMTIAPGMFRTPMIDMLNEQQKDALGSRVPFPNRLGLPDEYASLVMSVVANPMLNGETIRLDGAYRL